MSFCEVQIRSYLVIIDLFLSQKVGNITHLTITTFCYISETQLGHLRAIATPDDAWLHHYL